MVDFRWHATSQSEPSSHAAKLACWLAWYYVFLLGGKAIIYLLAPVDSHKANNLRIKQSVTMAPNLRHDPEIKSVVSVMNSRRHYV